MAITIIVTNAGRAALVNAANTGTNAVTITQLGVTATVFVPNAAQVALPGEIKRIGSVAGVVVADDQIHVTASDVTADAYSMRGFGLYLADGTLFAIYGQADEILNKTPASMMLLAADIAFADIDAEMIVFGDTNFILPPATTEILGLVELATTAEAQAGADATRVLTPLTGKQSVLGWLLSQDGSGSGLDADLLDGFHASSFAAAGHNHDRAGLTGFGTMAGQNADDVNIHGGAINGVTLNNVQGNSGFGTAAPSEKIHIAGNLLIGREGEPTTYNIGFFSRAPEAGTISWDIKTNDATGGAVTTATIAANGNVGIGTLIPAYRLHVAGSFAVGLPAAPSTYNVGFSPRSPAGGTIDWDIKTNDASFGPRTTMTLTANGSVGVGTISPAAMFDVAGTARILTSLHIAGSVAWHAGNDGSGSGLDADLLDGQQGAFYLPAGSYTAADVLTKLLGVDGSGSGLDADLLDGQQGAFYLPSASYTAADVLAKLVGVDGSGSGVDADLLDGQQGAFYLPAASYTAADVLAKLVGVDGSGSGIDADLLDGHHASVFDRVIAQSLTAEGGYIVYASGRKECWGTVFVNQDSYATWNLPVEHTSWCHPTFTYTGKIGVNNTADNTMFAGFIGAPPGALRFWNAEDTSLTIYIRTIGV